MHNGGVGSPPHTYYVYLLRSTSSNSWIRFSSIAAQVWITYATVKTKQCNAGHHACGAFVSYSSVLVRSSIFRRIFVLLWQFYLYSVVFLRFWLFLKHDTLLTVRFCPGFFCGCYCCGLDHLFGCINSESMRTLDKFNKSVTVLIIVDQYGLLSECKRRRMNLPQSLHNISTYFSCDFVCFVTFVTFCLCFHFWFEPRSSDYLLSLLIFSGLINWNVSPAWCGYSIRHGVLILNST